MIYLGQLDKNIPIGLPMVIIERGKFLCILLFPTFQFPNNQHGELLLIVKDQPIGQACY